MNKEEFLEKFKINQFMLALPDLPGENQTHNLELRVGVAWNPKTDDFFFSVAANKKEVPNVVGKFIKYLHSINNKDDVLRMVEHWKRTDKKVGTDVGEQLSKMLEGVVDEMQAEYLLDV